MNRRRQPNPPTNTSSTGGDTATAIGASGPPTQTPTPTNSAQSGSVGMTFDQVENTWINAGGNPQAASMAAAVSDAESGLNPNATRTNPDGTTSVGLWLIPANGTPPGSTDPIANARAAVQLSNNGQDWTQWCSTWSDNNCGQDNGTYLGTGANALMSLQTQAQSPSYQMFGSTPAGTGVGAAATASGTSTSGTTTSSTKKLLLIGVVVVLLIVVVMATRKRGAQVTQPAESELPVE